MLIPQNKLMHKILEQEWDLFKKENEDAMRNEGIDDVNNLIEESMWDEEAELYLKEEEENFGQAMDEYRAIVCVNCKKAALVPTKVKGIEVSSCPNCGFYATEMCLTTILQASNNHSMQCYGLISYIMEPGTDGSIIAVCNVCDQWDLFTIFVWIRNLFHMTGNNFSSCEQYLFKPLRFIRERAPGSANVNCSISSLLDVISKKGEPENEQLLLDSIDTLIDSLKASRNADFLGDSGYSVLSDLLPLINSSNDDIRASAYVCLQYLSNYLDEDEVALIMMDQLANLDWNFFDAYPCYQIARLSSVYFELLGKSLERMTRPRDWMLFLPFLANYLVAIIDMIVKILVKDSSFGSSDNQPTLYDKICILISNSCLDLIQFLHSRTVVQDPATFPFDSKDIGKESGDTKRRYLAFFLTNLMLEKVIANFDMQLSETYFKMQNPVYASRIKIHRSGTSAKVNSENEHYKPMYEIVHRTMDLANKYGLSFERMHQLQTSIGTKTVSSEKDNDLQMINSTLYPLSYNGIAILLSLSLYDKTIYPQTSSKSSMGLFDGNPDVYNMAQKCSERTCETDKAIFTMLYMADHIKNVVVSQRDLDKMIPGPCGNEDSFPVSRIIEIISTAASTCPDSTVRFAAYKLIEKFINYGDENTQLFLFDELLVRCPYPSMKVAAIQLLKDHICRIWEEKKVLHCTIILCKPPDSYQCKFSSVFASPIVLTEFVPIILQFKEAWVTNQSEFWNDYSHIMQAIAFYRILYQKDRQKYLMSIIDTADTMYSLYFEPLSKLLGSIDTQDSEKSMQIQTIKHQIELVQNNIFGLD
ncbi:hypothetical protein [Parasitella parasitica]|uniref:Uncharacterized protein n=1 Tax=Parasitella parasitica TaxID=35722 RepID=A0A0B7NST6_9FUNG|nr:hypothetical protein [Parasitella parasitica]